MDSRRTLKAFFESGFDLFSAGPRETARRPWTKALAHATLGALVFMSVAMAPGNATMARVEQAPAAYRTAHSTLIGKLNGFYRNAGAEGLVIVTLDADSVSTELGLRQDPTDPDARRDAVADQLQRTLPGYVTYDNMLDMLEGSLAKSTANAANYPARRGSDYADKTVCIVVPATPDLAGFSHWAKLSSLDPSSYKPGLQTPGAEWMERYIAYHELGHCLDLVFDTGLNDSDPMKAAHSRHRGEVFADVYAVLAIGSQNGAAMADWLSIARRLSSGVAGPKFTTPGFTQDEWGVYAGAVYHTGPALAAAAAEIRALGPKLDKMTVAERVALATRLTRENALTRDRFDLLHAWHRDPAKVEAEMKGWRDTDPRRAFLRDYDSTLQGLKKTWLGPRPVVGRFRMSDADFKKRVDVWQAWAKAARETPETFEQAAKVIGQRRDEIRATLDGTTDARARFVNEEELRAIGEALHPEPPKPEKKAAPKAPAKAVP